ncbi:MAG: formyltetrahydrofolate deformylase [Planctomycetota bacterium]
MSTPTHGLRLIATCGDRVGIVARVATFLAENGASITEANQHEAHETQMFFMRYVIDYPCDADPVASLGMRFKPIAEELGMEWRLTAVARRQRVAIFVSKFDHCLAYLLHRWKVGDLNCDICCVVSNHDDLRELVEWYGIPYHHISVPKEAKAKEDAFERTADCIQEADPDTIVLARYMQIIPPWLCSRYRHRIINIHHSFLPSFIGAKPYHQAMARGVKLIGATCHYVTQDLDAGPIIEQDVVRVHHRHTIQDMIRLGKDVENTVLAKGLRCHLEDRVLVDGNKTIMFE